MDRRRLLVPVLIGLVGILAVVGYLLGQGDLSITVEPTTSSTNTPVPTTIFLRPSRVPATGNQPIATFALPGDGQAIDTPVALPTVPPPAPDSDEPIPPIVYANTGQLWRNDGAGNPSIQLTTFPPDQIPSHPAFSPDGQQIAFVLLVAPPITATLPLPSSKLFLIDRDGQNQRELWAPEEGLLSLPSWTPDGQALYMFANGSLSDSGAPDDGNSKLQIIRYDLTTGERRLIVSRALDPALSHDGSQLTYLAFDDDGVTMHLNRSAADGSQPIRVVDGKDFLGLYAPRFTPDGNAIIFAGIEGPPTDQRGFPISNSSEPGLLDRLFGWLEPPTAAAHGAPWDLWIVNIDGSGLRRLTFLYDDLPMATFSPDGEVVAVLAYNGMYLMNPDGSNLRRIQPVGDHGGIDWDRAR
ncbi:MAG: hypothetical protein Fur005_13000 [Roseiflexaceae bacterium]